MAHPRPRRPMAVTEIHTASRLARVLPVARLGWAMLGLLLIGLTLVAAPVRFGELQTLRPASTPQAAVNLRFVASVDSTRAPLQLSQAEVDALAALGLPLSAYAMWVVVCELLFLAGSAVLGGVMFWRRSHDWLAIYSSLTYLLFGMFYVPVLSALVRADYAWRTPVVTIIGLAASCALMFCFIFPDGRFIPRWMRWVAAGWGAWIVLLILYVPANPFNWPPALYLGMFTLMGLFASGAQIYRYLRVSSPAQRQQTRPFIFGVSLSLMAFVVFNFDFIARLWPAVRQPGMPLLIYNIVSLPAYLILVFLPGIAVVVAILRYRLWDIDFILRKTAAYSLLTASLSLIYIGAVLVLLAIFQRVAPQLRSALVVSLATIVIAALFAPLRNTIKSAIDQRFYRERYDAEATLSAFGAQARSEVDLSALTAKLIAAVNDAMHPAHITIWLRSRERKP